MKSTIKIIMLICISALFLIQCKKDPIPVNENELITRIALTFTDSTTLTEQTFLYTVNDAVYGTRIDTIELIQNTKYGLAINLYSATNISNDNDVDTITHEIVEEGTAHQLFILSNSFNNFNYEDADENDMPIGLISSFTTNATPTQIQVLLLHNLNKFGTGVNLGNPANSGSGTIDVDITFPIKLINLVD